MRVPDFGRWSVSLEAAIEEIVERAVRRVLREEQQPELLTPERAGALIGLSAKTIRKRIQDGQLQRYGSGRRPLVSKKELLALEGAPKAQRELSGRVPSAEAEARRLMTRRTG